MHPHTRLKQLLNRRFDRILAVLTRDPLRLSPPAWHSLRVEIKKVRAMLDIIAFCDPAKGRRQWFLPLRRLFRKAGAVRDLQVAAVFFGKASLRQAGHEVNSRLAGALAKARKDFSASLTAKQVTAVHALKRRSAMAARKLKKKDIERYFEKTQRRIGSQLHRKEVTDVGLHRLRRELKCFFYNSKALRHSSQKVLNRLDSFQELLGLWHDCIMAEELLERWVAGRQRNGHLRIVRAGIHKKRLALFRQLQKRRKEVRLR